MAATVIAVTTPETTSEEPVNPRFARAQALLDIHATLCLLGQARSDLEELAEASEAYEVSTLRRKVRAIRVRIAQEVSP